MIRILVNNRLTEDVSYIKASGLSTDTKPTDGIATGSIFQEVDTGDEYAFAEGDSPTWYKIKSGTIS